MSASTKTSIVPSPVKTAHPPSVHPQPAKHATNLIHLITLCLAGLTTGLNNVPSFTPIPPENITGIIITTALPYTLGTILTAATLHPLMIQSSRYLHHHHPGYSLLATASLLIAAAHASSSLLLLFCNGNSSSSTATAFLGFGLFLLGVGNTLVLTITTLLCCGPGPGMLGQQGLVVYGMVALGVVVRVVVIRGGVVDTTRDGGLGITRDDGVGITAAVGGGQHLVMLGLALVTAGFVGLVASRRLEGCEGGMAAVGVGCDDAGTRTPSGHDKTLRLLFADQDGYPPPASRAVVLGALFAFAYHAAVVAIPAWLVLLTVADWSGATGQSSLAHATATFWAGVAAGRFMVLPWAERTRRQRRQFVSSALLGTGGFLLVCWLVLGSIVRSATVAAAVAGFLLGPVYPWVVGVLMREMIAYLEALTVLHLVIAGLFGGMLVCWNGLMDTDRGVDSGLQT
ncbi:hypothetical protein C8A00DRAFT_32679 [Chaetomidium leptoderma]|uniref:Uncharacterized protein n=1 Tax=Chaetomidium leptoderma TaxID=669021 RepID=A0AAN6VNK0_9PEZI|nr:hypothetical protein C8A00DRAFT_32679 [Chaetomidium leptoderma]